MLRKHQIDNHLTADHTNPYRSFEGAQKKRGIPGHETVHRESHPRARAPDDWRFVLTLRDRLKTEFGYTTDLPRPSGDDANLVDEFLFEWQRGHCEYFATALVVLLRASGIPARIVNGFLGASYNAVGDYYFVTQANAHSWVEVYVPEEGWLRVDPTPGGTPDMGRSGWLGNVQDSIDALRLRWFRWVVEYDLEKQYTLARDAFQAVSGGG